jgi:hypothetical protein
VSRPLLSMKTAMVVLNRDERQVMRLIKQGALAWAFDVRRASSQRAAVRIFRPCLAEYLETPEPPGPDPRNLEEVLHAILADDAPLVPATAVARAFGCSGAHITNLIRDGLLIVARSSPRRAVSAGLSREGVLEFLRQRRIRATESIPSAEYGDPQRPE